MVERSRGMRKVGGLIPACVKEKTLKFEALLSFQYITVENDWPARG